MDYKLWFMHAYPWRKTTSFPSIFPLLRKQGSKPDSCELRVGRSGSSKYSTSSSFCVTSFNSPSTLYYRHIWGRGRKVTFQMEPRRWKWGPLTRPDSFGILPVTFMYLTTLCWYIWLKILCRYLNIVEKSSDWIKYLLFCLNGLEAHKWRRRAEVRVPPPSSSSLLPSTQLLFPVIVFREEKGRERTLWQTQKGRKEHENHSLSAHTPLSTTILRITPLRRHQPSL